jgi:hypothetical protein
MRTADARAVLPMTVLRRGYPPGRAGRRHRRARGLDYELLGRAIDDRIASPCGPASFRFAEAKAAALAAAPGSSISQRTHRVALRAAPTSPGGR